MYASSTLYSVVWLQAYANAKYYYILAYAQLRASSSPNFLPNDIIQPSIPILQYILVQNVAELLETKLK